MVMELARLLARVSTTHTLELAFFNGEEEGVLASTAYARELAQQGARVDAYLGFDMVGIAYPSKAGCLCIYADARASEDLVPLEETVAFSLLREPRADDQVQVFPKNDRNSDEASFVAAGFPTLRWSGLRHAGDYWAYHKLNDTMDTVLAEAGGAPAFDGGLESTSATAYYTALALDHRTD
jgi:Zn-dependent M28 family amino/carboxypeptidase